MIRLAFASCVAVCAVLSTVSFTAQAAEPLTPQQREAVKALIRETLEAEPDLVFKALTEVERRQEKAEADRAAKALVDLRPQLEQDPADIVIGPTDADATIVEFFDYRCTYCKLAEDRVKQAVAADGKVRLVLKHLPILGPQSLAAARVSLAAQRQAPAKFMALHKAMIAHRGAYDDPTMRKMAEEAGLDLAKLDADLKDPTLTAPLARSMDLAKALGINGTPAFVIGEKLIPGAVEADALKAALAEARKLKKS